MSSSSSPCAACKLLRRKCTQGCVFAPYFPPGEPHKFANVHKVFGASNVSKLLQVYRTIAASSLNLSSSLPSCHAMTCLALPPRVVCTHVSRALNSLCFRLQSLYRLLSLYHRAHAHTDTVELLPVLGSFFPFQFRANSLERCDVSCHCLAHSLSNV